MNKKEILLDIINYTNEIDDLTAIELHPKYKNMGEIKEEATSKFQQYQTTIEKETQEIKERLSNYEFDLSQIMNLESIEEIKKEYIKLEEKYSIDELTMELSEAIEETKEIKDSLDSLDNLVYSNSLTKTYIIEEIEELISIENWKEYDKIMGYLK